MEHLTPEQWSKIRALLEQALDLPPAERAAFLDQACDGDTALRHEVVVLLDAEAQAGALLDEPLEAFAGDLVDILEKEQPPPSSRTQIGRQIGPYHLLKQLGAGGMGTVYLARREDFKKLVALKLIRPGMDTEEILQRFRNERQILAALDHPNIARLFDGGQTEEGLPYLVMEYVEGLPIDRYCDRHRLSIAERLELFQKVCAAVQFAHQNLVVHRDLKPSNILATEDGQVKLLDFGIAKVLNPQMASVQMAVTRTGLRMLTPEYASPEQVLGEPITTASDVYALGVLLYELLTGHRPYRLKTRLHNELARVIVEEEPARPSTAVTEGQARVRADGTTGQITPEDVGKARSTQPERLKRRLQGDLDNIVLMALRKEPKRRYGSAAALGEDLRRYLVRLPVSARPATAGYRMRKFIERHRVGVVMTATFLVLLVGFVVFYTVRLTVARNRAEQAQTQAEQEARKAEQVTEFVVKVFEVSDPDEAKGETITAREILDRGVGRIEEELVNQPAVRAEMLGVMGRVYQSLGLYPSALPLLGQALQIRQDLYGETHLDVATSLDDLAILQEQMGHYDVAEQNYREALAMKRKLLGEEHSRVATSQNNLGRLLYYKGAADEAEQHFREALALRRRLLGNDHLVVAGTLNNLALLRRDQGDHAEAERLFGEALAIKRVHLGEHTSVVRALNNLAGVLRDMGDSTEAERLYREALAMSRKLLDEHPEVANTLSRLAVVLHDRGDYAAAEPLFREALAMRRKLLGERHPGTTPILVGLGRLFTDQGRPSQAEPLLREALQIRERALPEGHWRRASAQSTLGACLSTLHRFDEAEPLLLAGYEGLRETRGEQNVTTQRARQDLIAHYERRGVPEQAAAYRAPAQQ